MPRSPIRRIALALTLVGGSLIAGTAPSAAQSSTNTCTSIQACNSFKDWCLGSGTKAGVKASIIEVEVDGTTLQRCHLHR